MLGKKIGNSQTNLFHAFDYLKRGWKVLPIHFPQNGRCSCGKAECHSPAKHPLTRNGVKDATDETSVVFNVWNERSLANIGIATGYSSGIAVVDIDPRHGGDKSWQEFELKNQIAPSLTVVTGGGGRHIYFLTDGTPVPNKIGVLPGIDIRGDNGYVLAPPSQHMSGNLYTWADKKVEIAAIPKSIKDLISKIPQRP